jgi:hypothetical protein
MMTRMMHVALGKATAIYGPTRTARVMQEALGKKTAMYQQTTNR